MGLTPKDRQDAARAAIDAEQNSAESPIHGKPYGPWKLHPEKGWVQEATDGSTTIYKPWVGPMGSSPMNPNPDAGTDAASQTKPNILGTEHNPTIAGALVKTLGAPIKLVTDILIPNKKALGR